MLLLQLANITAPVKGRQSSIVLERRIMFSHNGSPAVDGGIKTC